MNRKLTTPLCILSLLALNVWIMARVFRTGFSLYLSSIEGAYVGLSRWLLEHRTAEWFPLWYGGIPAQNAYPPLLHQAVAFVAWATGMPVVNAHHAVTAAFYCLAPVALFLLVLRMSGSRWKGFIAAWIYSLVSPSAFLLPIVRHDLPSVWSGRKLQTLIKYGEGPHVASMTLLLVALAAIYAAMEAELGWWTVAAVMASAAVALTNWLGGMALACGVLALAIASGKPRWGRIALIGILAYAVAMPWIPPSDIATVEHNAQMVEGNFRMGHAEYAYLAGWLLTAAGMGLALRKTTLPEASRFALVFLFLMAAPPIGYDYLKIYPLPQPDRYHLEMDLAIAMVAGVALGSARLGSKYGWWRPAVGLGLAALTVHQAPRLRSEVRAYLPPFDITKSVEREQALWIGSHYPGQRAFLSGSSAFWFNAFADNPQLGGGFDQGRSNPAIAAVTYAIPYVKGNGNDTVALLKAYGVRAIAVGGEHTRDAYRNYRDAGKFQGAAREVWRDGDDAIYEIPGSGKLAHVISRSELVTTNALDWPAVSRYAAALDAGDGRIQMQWNGPDRIAIQAELAKTEAVTVQVNWDPGWRASVNGLGFPAGKDALGLLALEPDCEGRCSIELTYDGGMEGRIARLCCALGLAACGYLAYRSRRRGQGAA